MDDTGLSLTISVAGVKAAADEFVRSIESIKAAAASMNDSMSQAQAGVQRSNEESAKSTERLQKQYDSLRGALDPATKALMQYRDAMNLADRAMNEGVIKSQSEYHAILAQAKDRYTETVDGLDKMGAAHSRVHGSSLAMREGFVLVHEFMSGNYRRAIGSATIELQALVGAQQILNALMNPYVLAGLAVTGVLIAMAVRAAETSAQLREFNAEVKGLGADATLTGTQLQNLYERMRDLGIAAKEAQKAATEIGKSDLNSNQADSLSSLARDVAGTKGIEYSKAVEALIPAYKGLWTEFEKYNKQLKLVDADQLKAIYSLAQLGDQSATAAAMVDAITKNSEGVGKALDVGMGAALKAVGRELTHFIDDLNNGSHASDYLTNRFNEMASALKEMGAALKDGSILGFLTGLMHFDPVIPHISLPNMELSPADLEAAAKAQAEAQNGHGGFQRDKFKGEVFDPLLPTIDPGLKSVSGLGLKQQNLLPYTSPEVQEAQDKVITSTKEQIKINAELSGQSQAQQVIERAGLEATAKSRLAGESSQQQNFAGAMARAKAESDQALKMQGVYDANALSLRELTKVMNAYGVSTAAGIQAEADMKGALEHTKDNTDAARIAQDERNKKSVEGVTALEKHFDALKLTTEAEDRLSDASALGANALKNMAIHNEAVAITAAAAASATGPQIQKVQELQVAIENLLKKAEGDKENVAYNNAVQAEKDKIEVLKKEIELSGQLPEIRKEEVEQLKAAYEYKKLFPNKTQEEIDALVRLRAEQGKLQGQLEEQDKAAKAMHKIWDGFYTGVSNSFFKMLDDVTTKGKDAFQTFADNIKAVFKKLAMEIAAQLIFKPILQQIGGSLGISDLLGSGSSGSGGGSLFGNSGTGGLDIIGGIKSIGSWLSGGFDSLFGSASAGAANAASAASGLPAGYSMGGQGVAGGFNSGGAAEAAASSGGGGGSIFSGGGDFTTLSGANGLAAGLGAGFAGFSIGQMLTSLLGEKSQGSQVGGGIGGVAGFAVGGPVGAFIGSVLGSLLGGLFGPGKHHDAASVNIETAGQDTNGNYTQFTAGNSMGNMTDAQASLLKDLGSVAAAENQLIQTLGGTVKINPGLVGKTDQSGIPSPGFVGYNDQTKNWDLQWTGHDVSNIKEADLPGVIMREMTKWLVENNAVTGFSDTQKQIVNSTSFGKEVDPQKLANDIAFGDVYDNIIKIAQGSTDYGKAASATAQTLTALDKYFADATTQANDLGLATDQFATAAQKAKESVGTAFVGSIQDQIDQLDGKGFLKSLRGFTTQAQGQFDDLKKLFDSGAFGDVTTDVAKASYESAKTLAATLQAKEASSVLVGLTASQISAVVDAFKDDTSVFGKAIEAAARAIQDGTAIIGAGVDAVTFHDKTVTPLDAALRNAQSVLDPSLKAANDAINLAEQRRLSLAAALAVANLDDAQKLYIETTMRQTWALEDQAAVAGKAQTAMASATAAMKQFGTTINDYINKSSIDQLSGKSPTEILAATKQQFQDQLAAAQGGDSTALGGITSYAQNYRQAISTYYGGNAQGSKMSQDVLDQLAALLKTPGLTSNIANSTLRNQGDGSITVNDLGYVFLNGKVIPGVKTTNASLGTEISAFQALGAQYSNGMSTDAYSKLAGQRDVVLAGYNDTQLQNVSNYAYGGQKVNSLDSFLQYLHGLDNNWLTANAGQDSTGGKTGPKQVASYEATIQTASAVSPTGAVPLGLSKIETAINDNLKPALIDSLNVRLHTDIGLLQTMMHTDIGALNATLSDTVGKAIATIPALVSSVTEMVGEVQGLQSQVISLTAQLTAVQIAAAKQAADDAAALLAATNRQTQTLTSPGGMAGSRAA